MKIRILISCVLFSIVIVLSSFLYNAYTQEIITTEEAYEFGSIILMNSNSLIQDKTEMKIEDQGTTWRVSSSYNYNNNYYVDFIDVEKRTGRAVKYCAFSNNSQ